MKTKIPIGPFHVGLEEPIYFKITLNGETVDEVDMINGFVHRGIEYLAMQKNFFQNLILTERVCALCSNNHPFTYVMAVEKIAGIKISKRAEYLRVIADEVKRIASHMFNLSMLAHLIGFHSLMTQTMEAREIVQDIKESIWGNRMDMSANTLSGVKYDLNESQIKYILKSLDKVEKEADELIDIYFNNKLVKARTVNVGVLPKEDAIRLGVAGPTARGSGVNNDVRLKAPYAAYDELKPKFIIEEGGDVYSRMRVRWREVKDSIRLLRDALNNLPEGPIVTQKRPHIPAGEAVTRSEAPRGELIYYLKTNGSQKPERMRWRVPTYMNWEALRVMIPGNKLSDVAVIFNSIDPCISCTER
ncbi:MAG: nickel-dependent hydrogenase large subunit [Nautiliaceae bacterium]|jgi:Ni,Fe-hydrogenase III large subunit